MENTIKMDDLGVPLFRKHPFMDILKNSSLPTPHLLRRTVYVLQ